MTDTIEPALTPDEWARLAESGGGVAESVHRYFTGLFIGIRIGEPQLMALANAALPDNDPRKITREMIAAIRYCAQTVVDELEGVRGLGEPSASYVAAADRAAAALSALLPP